MLDDADAAIARAQAAGVSRMLLAGVAPEAWERDDVLATRHESLVVSYGLHPQLVPTLDDAACDRIVGDARRALARRGPRVVAVGEIGLDGVGERARVDDRQERVFRAQLALARAASLAGGAARPARASARARRPARRARGRAAAVGRRLHRCSASPELVQAVRGARTATSRFSGSLTWHGGANKAARAAAVVPRDRLRRRDRRARPDAGAAAAGAQRARLPRCNRGRPSRTFGASISPKRRASPTRTRAACSNLLDRSHAHARARQGNRVSPAPPLRPHRPPRRRRAPWSGSRRARHGRRARRRRLVRRRGAGALGHRHALARRLRSRVRHQHQPPAAGGGDVGGQAQGDDAGRARARHQSAGDGAAGAAVLQRQDVRRDPRSRGPTSSSTPSTTSPPSVTSWPRARRAAFRWCRRRARRGAWIRRSCAWSTSPRRRSIRSPTPCAARCARSTTFRRRGRSASPPSTRRRRRRCRTICTTTAATASAASARAARNDLHCCEERRVIYGTAGFVTGAFGLACASVVVRAIAGSDATSALATPVAPPARPSLRSASSRRCRVETARRARDRP